MTRWLATAGRISLFTTPTGGQQSAATLFKAIVGTEPEAFDKVPVAGGALSNARGPFDDFSLTCSVAPLRIDLTLMAARPSSFFPGAPFQFMDDPAKLLSSLERLRDGIVGQAQLVEATRVAMFLQMTHSAKDVRAGNDVLKSVLPIDYVLPLTDEEDVIIQINRKQESTGTAATRMNFITRWSVELTKVLNLEVGSTNLSRAPITADYFFVHVVFDNNTVPRESILSSDELKALLSELISGTPSRNAARLVLEEVT
jgi:hypothetical protein